ncbi:MoaD/ThiS family protein [Candidatus Spongiihabitans sp.]|uniref:MoaD/ThiS family protein n=1 Tax=Candidatus Spongiihabitans sp. TaxID=3101308 RepID=UPI003C6FACB3
MSITVRFFASLSEELGFDQKTLDRKTVAHKFPLTIEDVWREVAHRPPPENLLCALNHEYADFKQHLEDGDEVAFFPPVNGG